MRIVIALGGNALLKRGEAMTAEAQRRNIREAAVAIAPLADEHEIIITHGNGPQVGLLALQSECLKDSGSYPLDVIGAESEGMIGYLIEQELGNVLPEDKPIATILTMVEVDPDDPAFLNPAKFVGGIYSESEAAGIQADKGWTFKKDGDHFRRVVPSPAPLRIFEIKPIKWLIEKGAIVICAGGGGIPTAFKDGKNCLAGVEAVIDKDLAAELLAEETDADLLIMATDVGNVCINFREADEERIGPISASELKKYSFPAGSMGPKVEAAVKFAENTGRIAAIGALKDIGRIANGEAGTVVLPSSDYLPEFSATEGL